MSKPRKGRKNGYSWDPNSHGRISPSVNAHSRPTLDLLPSMVGAAERRENAAHRVSGGRHRRMSKPRKGRKNGYSWDPNSQGRISPSANTHSRPALDLLPSMVLTTLELRFQRAAKK